MLGVSRSHFYSLQASGRLPLPVRLGGAVRWRRTELEMWVLAGCPPRDRWRRAGERGAVEATQTGLAGAGTAREGMTRRAKTQNQAVSHG